MTDLTEQYQKGELPEGVYYVLYYKNDTAEVDIYRRVYSLYDESEVRFTIPQVTKILAPVPSYEEWQATEKYNKHLEEVIKIYERKDKQATETSIAYNELLEENAQIKEQLESETLAKNEGAEIISELQSKVKGYEELWYEANRRICMLTGLLVESKECVEENLEFSKSIGRNRIKPRNKGLLKRIDEALK